MIIKLLMDKILSLLGILAMLPIFVITAFAIKLDSPGPVLFRQTRVGYKGKQILVYKFRSMIDNAEKIGAGIYFNGENDERITKVGKFIRKTSIDELPQLVNVLLGDMSIVGPRPLLPVTIDQMSDLQRKRLEVKPGISGWAQVNGRNDLNRKERFEKDIWYIDHYSIWLDLKIILMTVKVVLFQKGVKVGRKKEDIEVY